MLLRCGPDGSVAEVVPPDFNVRSRVHEYGGGAYIVRDGTVYCVNFSDQRVYRIVAADALNSTPVPEALTPPGPWRYADFDVDVRRQHLICVREDHAQFLDLLLELRDRTLEVEDDLARGGTAAGRAQRTSLRSSNLATSSIMRAIGVGVNGL